MTNNNGNNGKNSVMIPLQAVRRALYSDPAISPYIQDYNTAIYPFMAGFFAARNSSKMEEVDYIKPYCDYLDSIVDEGQRIAVIAVMTFWSLNSWIKAALSMTLKKKESIDVETESTASIFDSGVDYGIMDELSTDRGFMNHEDIARDIVTEAVVWIHDVRTNAIESSTDLPWNRLIARYRATSRELHARHNMPSLDEVESYESDSEGFTLNMATLAQESNAVACSYGRESDIARGYMSAQQALIELNADLVAALYPKKRDSLNQDSYTFLYDCGGYYMLDYAALRSRINYLKRTKSGVEAIARLESELGFSRIHRGELLSNGKARLSKKTVQKSYTGNAISRLVEVESYSAPLASAKGLERARKGKVGTKENTITTITTVETFASGETQKTTTRGRGRPKKKGRGRPRKMA